MASSVNVFVVYKWNFYTSRTCRCASSPPRLCFAVEGYSLIPKPDSPLFCVCSQNAFFLKGGGVYLQKWFLWLSCGRSQFFITGRIAESDFWDRRSTAKVLPSSALCSLDRPAPSLRPPPPARPPLAGRACPPRRALAPGSPFLSDCRGAVTGYTPILIPPPQISLARLLASLFFCLGVAIFFSRGFFCRCFLYSHSYPHSRTFF